MKKKIRVLHVAEAAGGVERYLETLFKYTDHNQVENILICSQNYDYERIKQLADRVIVIKMAHQIDSKADFKAVKAIRHYIKRITPDIVYAHSSKAGALARIADLGIKNKVIYNPHGWAFNMQQSAKKKEMYKWVERISAHFCDKIVCISDAEKESALREKICKPSKLQVIYNGIDLEEIKNTKAKTRNELNIPEDAFVVGQVGRLSEQKAPDVFVKAAKLIKEKIPNAYFILVGDGELRNQIEVMIHKAGLDGSFLITGWVDNPAAYMKIMNVGTLLSRWEGFGLVLPEYMACGVPIVATDVDAIPTILTSKKTGLLVQMDNALNVFQSIFSLYKNQKLKSMLIRDGYEEVIIKYNGHRMVLANEKLYVEGLEYG